VVRYVQQIIQYGIGPAIGGVLAAGRTEAGFAGVRNHLDFRARGTLIDVAAERRCPAGSNLPDGLEHDRPDPAALRLEEVFPVSLEDRDDPITDLRANAKHQCRSDNDQLSLAASVRGRDATAVVWGRVACSGASAQGGANSARTRSPLYTKKVRARSALSCVPSMNGDSEVEVLWGVGRSDPSEPQGEGNRTAREGGAERSG